MNHSASTSIFQATHTHSELSNVLLSTRLPNAQIQHGGNEREREGHLEPRAHMRPLAEEQREQ